MYYFMKTINMENNKDRGIGGWGSSLFAQSTEEVARAIAAATSDSTINNISPVSPRPSVIFSSKDEDPESPLKKLHFQIGRILKGLSPLSEVKKSAYNPEILTSQKRQWARFQMQSMDHKSVPEPSKLIESMVVVGLHPKVNVQEIQNQIVEKSHEDAKKLRGILYHHNQVHADLNLEPEVLFVYPPDKKLPLNYKDLISFCFPAGVEIRAVERTPSLSELNQMLLGQEQVNQNDVSYVFRLQVADNSTLYGCCYLIEELVQKPSNLVSSVLGKQRFSPTLSRHVLTTPRCYCILSRLPFFELHFGILKSIFTEERFEGLEMGIEMLNLLALQEDFDDINKHMESLEFVNGNAQETSFNNTMLEKSLEPEQETIQEGFNAEKERTNSLVVDISSEAEKEEAERERVSTLQNGHAESERHLPCPALISFQGSLYEDGNFSRSCMDDSDIEEPSVSGQDDSNRQNDIFNWAKANKHGSLQIICKYHRLQCPARGSTITFQPLEHLNPLGFHRPSESILDITGSNIDVRSCNNSLEIAEAYGACMAEEEAAALSAWTVACICGSLRLEHVMLMFAGALLEKNIVIVCSNLGILSASVLSIISLIRPYQWQSLLMPVLPNDMLDFLEAPVPYIIGIKNKSADVLSKLINVILVDANKNQVKSPSMPQLPQHKELFSSLSPYHAKLVGESYLARKRPVYECTDVQIEAAKGFLGVLRTYLDSLCSNLRSHTITNVQSNEDKVSLLLKESFIDSFPSRDRPFMKQFVDTQLFSVHTDMVLSYYQKD